MKELEESVWSVVRQENEREDQGECIHDSGVRGRMHGEDAWALKKTPEYKLEFVEMRMLYGCAELRRWTRYMLIVFCVWYLGSVAWMCIQCVPSIVCLRLCRGHACVCPSCWISVRRLIAISAP